MQMNIRIQLEQLHNNKFDTVPDSKKKKKTIPDPN